MWFHPYLWAKMATSMILNSQSMTLSIYVQYVIELLPFDVHLILLINSTTKSGKVII